MPHLFNLSLVAGVGVLRDLRTATGGSKRQNSSKNLCRARKTPTPATNLEKN